MQKKSVASIFLMGSLFSGCAILDKTLAPMDSAINDTKTIYHDTSNYLDSSVNTITNKVTNTKSTLYETSLVKLFMSDEDIIKNREENFIKWSSSTKYDNSSIISRYLRDKKISINEKELLLSDKMQILKEYFFDLLKKEYISKFERKYPKVKFDMFLTDRENIEKIYQYKLALKEHEHQWNINLENTQKKVASLIISTLYGKPNLKFISYDPYSEVMYLSIKSKKENFDQKIKLKVDKEDAKKIKRDISYIKPTVYFKLEDNNLELVGASIFNKQKSYLAEFTNTTYFRQSTIVFSSDKIDLKEQDVEYTTIVQNITPPSWFYNLEDKQIGYGQGKNEKDAKADAFSNIAQSIKVVVNSNFTTKKNISGSIFTKSLKSDTNIKANDITIENSKVIKLEKKDGIWFVAIKY
ncbi:MAG: LPP20 family lipoprotein [Arcobacteraceae bacterium]